MAWLIDARMRQKPLAGSGRRAGLFPRCAAGARQPGLNFYIFGFIAFLWLEIIGGFDDALHPRISVTKRTVAVDCIAGASVVLRLDEQMETA